MFSQYYKDWTAFRRAYKKKWKVTTLWFWTVIILGSMYFLLIYITESRYPDRHSSNKKIQQVLSQSILEEKEMGCGFPELDPFAPYFTDYDDYRPTISCKGKDWVECYKSECSVVENVLNTMKNLVCEYKDIIYVEDDYYKIGDPVKVHGAGKYILNASDHVKVSCTGDDLKGLNFISHQWSGNKAGLRPITQKALPGRETSFNVLILCFDSTSRNGFRNRMPLSYKVLQEEMGATILKGYSIIGDGTPAAMFPLLSGKTELEHPEARLIKTKRQRIEPKQFIFHHLKDDGYRTAYFEDMPWIGSFQFKYSGFKSQPADHYLRPFLLEQFQYGANWWKGIKDRYCIGSLPQYGVLLNLTKQFTEVEGKHFSLTFISDITHDDFYMISVSDDDVVAFLRYLKNTSKLEDHLVIVMGDHGIRYEFLRQTLQGRLEERLPLMAIILPERLKRERPYAAVALGDNVDVLTTPFDIHTTIVDTIGRMDLANNYFVPESSLPRAMSLLERIPKSRTCGQASILPHWCVCYKWQNLLRTDPNFTNAGVALASFINNITEEKRSVCEERKLVTIQAVAKRTANEDLLNFAAGYDYFGQHYKYVTAKTKAREIIEDYQVKIVMYPGQAIFEATMKYIVKWNKFNISEGDVSRLTAYGNEPSCVKATHPGLNKFCYCKRSSSKDSSDIMV